MKLYRVRISMNALVVAKDENAAASLALEDREVISMERDNADASAEEVKVLRESETGTLAWGVPDKHPWCDMPVEKIAAEIAARDKNG